MQGKPAKSPLKDDLKRSRYFSKLELAQPLDRASEVEELAVMKWIDVSNADNFYESTFPKLKKKILAAAAEKNMDERIEIDKNFNRLMNIGFERRLVSELSNKISERDKRFLPLQDAAKYTVHRLELGKSKEEQLRDLQKQLLAKRSGVMKVIPQGLHKYIDYLRSLRVKTKGSEVSKNIMFGAFFSFITYVNQGRSSFMYFVVGHLIILSQLLTRNMPRKEILPGMDKNKKVASWSSNAFRTAAVIVALLTGASVAASGALLSPLLMPTTYKVKAVMIIALLSTSYFASFFEVFEEKSKNGLRWKKALEGNTMSPEEQAKLNEQVFGVEKNLNDLYDNNYDPEIDDYPPLPKYMDELDPADPAITKGGSGELDEEEAMQHFEAWNVERKAANRKPIEEAPPETPWVGSKVGMYSTNVPAWLSNAYQKNVVGGSKWRGIKVKFEKEYSDFEPIQGPFGFRDKRPEWLQIFGDGIWEERTSASRKAARAYGSYRKSMWRLDPDVVLQKSDGVEEIDVKGSKK